MKTIGMLGGMSWESTSSYYRAVNEAVKQNLGGLNSAKIVMVSVNFEEIERLQHQGKWDETAEILGRYALNIENAGADFLLICTNTMHKVAPQISKHISIPILHIADATAKALLNNGITRVGLIGTKFTMSQDFYKGRISKNYDIEVMVPKPKDQDIIHDIIYEELCVGKIMASSRAMYLKIMNKLTDLGCQAIILGCTEIALLVNQKHTKIPLYDTTLIHANAAAELATQIDKN